MYKNSNFRTLLALVLFFGIVLFGRTAFIYANTNSNTIEIEAAGSFYEDVPEAKGSILGAAQHFHIFSEKAVFHTHTNGNIATKELSGLSNAGTNKFGKEYFYFQNILEINGSTGKGDESKGQNKVVVGKNVKVTSLDKHPVLDGKKMDNLAISEVFQDKNNNVYIDFESEFQHLRKVNIELAH